MRERVLRGLDKREKDTQTEIFCIAQKEDLHRQKKGAVHTQGQTDTESGRLTRAR